MHLNTENPALGQVSLMVLLTKINLNKNFSYPECDTAYALHCVFRDTSKRC